ncbi:MAG: sulfatase [Planctomycetes bacterium]|nr:sulfatase [Planctomycetota bacterium]
MPSSQRAERPGSTPSTPRLPAVAALAALLVGACGDGERAGGTRASRGPAQRVILVTCDTLRADRLGFAGHPLPTSPNLDALAAESTVFENAWAAAPLTGPSLAALLTGRFPDEVGGGPTNRDHMPEEVLTIAEVVRDAGFRTAAFVSNGVLRRPPPEAGAIGVQQGFEVYDDAMNSKERNRDLLERTADACTDAALAWLAGRSADEAFFLWVHYQDPHGPYTPPAAHLAPLEGRHPSGPELPLGATHSGRGQIPRYQALPGLTTPGPYLDRYDAEVRYFDAELGRLLGELRRRDLLDEALLVVSADHGESLGEGHYWLCHGETLQPELVRVPLLVRYPARLTRGAEPPLGAARRVAAPVGHVDLWPTFVEALGLEAPRNRGLSLLGPGLPERRVLPQFLRSLDDPNRHLAVTDGRWRAVLVRSDPPRLYDLREDPLEREDVADRHPEVLADLQARYAEFMRSDPRPWSRPVRPALDALQRRGLQGLGYTDGDDH